MDKLQQQYQKMQTLCGEKYERYYNKSKQALAHERNTSQQRQATIEQQKTQIAQGNALNKKLQADLRDAADKYDRLSQEMRLTQARAREVILVSQHALNDFGFISELTLKLSASFQEEAERTREVFDEACAKIRSWSQFVLRVSDELDDLATENAALRAEAAELRQTAAQQPRDLEERDDRVNRQIALCL